MGNYIWDDANKDGKQDSTETALVGAKVNLLDAQGNPAKDLDGTVVAEQTTAADGKYLFANLPEGDYQVVVTAPTGYVASPNAGDVDTVPANDDSNCAADGKTALITLKAGTEPTDDGDTDANSNLTADCGFYKPAEPLHSVGNMVWIDNGAGTAANANNGLRDAGEKVAPDGVIVELWDTAGKPIDLGAGALQVKTTNGFYLFAGLPAGDYRVCLSAANFANGGVLAGYTASTGGNETDPNVDKDDTDNGLDDLSFGMCSNAVTLGANEPTGETPTASGVAGDGGAGIDDAHSNLTVDFALLPPPVVLSVGDTIWVDTDKDGVLDADEKGLPDVVVTLLDATGKEVATIKTDADGKYKFTGLPEGSYSVTVTAPTGYEFTTKGTDPNSNTDSNCAVDGKTDPFSLTVGTESVTDGDVDANTDLTQDCGLYKPAVKPTPVSIGNIIWDDTNKDGKQDVGEPALVGAVVSLLDNAGQPAKDLDGNPVANITIDDTGKYVFSNLAEGDYQVVVVPPAGYIASPNAGDPDSVPANDDSNCAADGKTALVTLLAGTESVTDGDTSANSDLTVDCGFYKPAIQSVSVGDTIWEDANKNGIQDVGEAPLANAIVALYNADGSPVIVGGDIAVAPQVTDAQGKYQFTGLPEGEYYVIVKPPVGYTLTTSPEGTNADIDNNPSNTDSNCVVFTGDTTIYSLPFTLTANGEPVDDGDADANSNLSLDCGFYKADVPRVSVGDLIWDDTNQDGVKDAKETGIKDVVVTLLDKDGNVVSTTKTDETGLYRFDNLPEGDYSITVTPPTDYQFTKQGTTAGANDDSNCAATGKTDKFTLTAGALPTNDGDTDANTDMTQDCGLFKPKAPVQSIGNRVWVDANNNGRADAGEAAVGAGVKLVLKNSKGVEVANTTTDAAGRYLFDSLATGSYRVCVVAENFATGGLLEGYNASTGTYEQLDANIGVDGSADSGIDGDDNGSNDTSKGLCSGFVTLDDKEPLNETTATGDDGNDGTGTPDNRSNLTVDFGVVAPTKKVAVGDKMWVDLDADGKQGTNEPGLAGVTVKLLDKAGNVVATQVTQADGKYVFNNLDDGDYSVVVIPPVGYLYTSNAGDPDTVTANNDSNCSAEGKTDVFSLAVGTEPTDDGDTDSNTNMSVDCGFVPNLKVPTLSQWGVAIMSMLLAGVAMLRRRRED